jgi:SAM-dependent methyltransferase
METLDMPDGFTGPDWWQTLYDDTVAALLLVRRDPAETTATVRFLIERLGLRQGATAFDQCCGIGSLALPLAECGVRVFGVDQSKEYVRRATDESDRRRLPCRFTAADALAFTAPEPCDAAFNWNTSFGNHPDDAGNRDMLRRAFESLKPGGRFALDYQHVPRVLRHFQHCLTHRLPTPTGDLIVLRESTVDLSAGALRQRWTFLMTDGRREERHSLVRLYLPHELAGLLAAAGFADVEFAGGVRGEPLTLDSPRCIALARRPDR